MVEKIQDIIRGEMSFQIALARQTMEEESLIAQNPTTLVRAYIVCADGFMIPVAVNRVSWGNKRLEVPSQIQVLHDQYHGVTGHDDCKGLDYDF